jgi:hypothetical protein
MKIDKISITSSGFELATFGLVAECLKFYAITCSSTPSQDIRKSSQSAESAVSSLKSSASVLMFTMKLLLIWLLSQDTTDLIPWLAAIPHNLLLFCTGLAEKDCHVIAAALLYTASTPIIPLLYLVTVV